MQFLVRPVFLTIIHNKHSMERCLPISHHQIHFCLFLLFAVLIINDATERKIKVKSLPINTQFSTWLCGRLLIRIQCILKYSGNS